MLFNLCFFLGLWVIGFIIFYLLNRYRLKRKSFKKLKEINYLVSKFKLDKNKISYKQLVFLVSITNSFIIAIVCTIICLIPLELIWQMLIGFVMLFILIYALYEVLGRICLKKGWKKVDKRKTNKLSRNRK